MSLSLSFDNQHFNVNGKTAYLASGELHYFRVPKAAWRERMELLKATGASMVATYIPWLLHEPEEGKFVIDSGDGVLDLRDYLRTAIEVGLQVCIRPGPYTYSELRDSGLPRWLLEKYPQIMARNCAGKSPCSSSISYLHPLFLEKAAAYYRWICPILADFTASRGGPITLFQLDNETEGIHLWYGFMDHNTEMLGLGSEEGRYAAFLRRRYGDITAVNDAYGTSFASFAQARPDEEAVTGLAKHRMIKDLGDLTSENIYEYFGFLRKIAVECGIDTPFSHNAGSIELTNYLKDIKSYLGDDVLLGCDHYWQLGPSWPQNNPTPQRLIIHYTSCELLRILGFPPNVMEFQYGTIGDWLRVTQEELRVALMAHLGFGVQGHNGYVFSGGPNHGGFTGKIYDYCAPIAADGTIRPHYHSIKEHGDFIRNYPELLNTAADTQIRVLMDWNIMRGACKDAPETDSSVGYGSMHRYLYAGAITTALTAGFMPVLVNPDDNAWERDRSTPLMVFSGGVMERTVQQRLVEYLRAGGNILFKGVLPFLDERYNSCSIFADALGMSNRHNLCTGRAANAILEFGGKDRPYNSGPLFGLEKLPEDAVVIATEDYSRIPVAAEIRLGAGHIIVDGSLFNLEHHSHAEWFCFEAARLGAQATWHGNNPWILPLLRIAPDGADRWLFLVNAGASTEIIDWHYDAGATVNVELPAMSVAVFKNTHRIF